MTSVAIYGYIAAAFTFVVLSILLAFAWRGRQVGGVLLLASVLSAVWASTAAYQASSGYFSSVYLLITEILRDAGWLGFLLLVMAKARQTHISRSLWWISGSLIVVVLVMLGLVVSGWKGIPAGMGFGFQIFVFLGLSLLGLITVEQIFRNASLEARWSIKYLCLGLGGLFAYDFYLYSDALLLRNLDENIWGARGYVNAIVMPLIAVSAARNPQWSLDVFVSRSFVFHSSAIMMSGIYLLAMASGGYYIKHIGGDWGGFGQLVFFFGAILILLVVLFSGQMRARLRVFLNKHFFNYRYDYREEWLRVIQRLSEAQLDSTLKTTVINVMAKIVESPGGMLWMQKDNGEYQLEAGWNMVDEVYFRQHENTSLLAFLSERKWVIDIDELDKEPESYQHLKLPPWLAALNESWLVVPLIVGSEVSLATSGGGAPSTAVMGFVVLRRPHVKMKINWEVRDLLLTTGQQCAGYLALLKANEALVDARQFEAFNRLSAFVVHDLKNLVAQLSLIVSNAERHKDNPAFIDDAFSTVDNTVRKMTVMLAQLRKGRVDGAESNKVELNSILKEVVKNHSKDRPTPQFISTEDNLVIIANENRFSAIIGHLLQNAQEATPDDGGVQLSICREGEHALLLIKDTGCGMDKSFLRERLFKPFDTTKGNAGMGIGVYESREFIYDLGGQLEVHSEPEKGTTFFIRLKLANDSALEVLESSLTLD
ncbi:MAG: PEP-CTERM system histidine kinase PrsK [Ectothiorhodospiraceae bacterium]|nr:PEP-CTERM system histidine kinase PrsK [Ectothiorhodospiraceae bacterium]